MTAFGSTALAPLARDLILGVDPGLTGGLAVYDARTGKLAAVTDMPTKECDHKRSGRELDVDAIEVFVDSWLPQLRGAVIEDVAAMPNQGVVGVFTFGYVTGLVTGIIGAHLIPIHKAKPAVWKSLMKLSRDKNQSVALARQLFPEFEHAFSKSLDGRAEAALLAKFGERIVWGVNHG